MTVQDLIDLCNDEGRDPKDAHLMMGVGGVAFDVTTADDQDPFNPGWFMCTLLLREDA